MTFVYLIIFLFLVISIFIWRYSHDLGLNLISQAIGTIFTVILLDNLINHSKTLKRKIVKNEIDYLISRNINRLRENVLSRLFDFNPQMIESSSDPDIIEKNIRNEREKKLEEFYKLTPSLVLITLQKDFSDKENIIYFEDRAAEIWQYLDMRHSEHLSPEIVQCLIDLYVNIKDLCAHMRIYNRGKLNLKKNQYYIEIASEGIPFNIKNIISLLIKLKAHGYSEIAKRE